MRTSSRQRIRADLPRCMWLLPACQLLVVPAFAAGCPAGEVELLPNIRALPPRDIAAQAFISVQTVKTHRANAMRKLGLRTTADIVRYAIENVDVITGISFQPVCFSLISIDVRKLTFHIEAWDELEKIGEALQERFVIDKDKFIARAQAKRKLEK